MKSLTHSLVIGATALVLFAGAAQAQQVKLKCTHVEGERLFMGSRSVVIDRTSLNVTVRPAPGEPVPATENWTYRVVYENPAVGFRAIRASRSEKTDGFFDVLLGGELFYIVENGAQRIVVSAINASTGQSSGATLACVSAP
jgi:hypothetical protein